MNRRDALGAMGVGLLSAGLRSPVAGRPSAGRLKHSVSRWCYQRIPLDDLCEAAKAIGVKVPVVVRLEGTNVEQGQEILRQSGLNFIVAEGMKDAAEKVVAATK